MKYDLKSIIPDKHFSCISENRKSGSSIHAHQDAMRNE